MRRELGQPSLADGLVDAGRNRQRTSSRRWSAGWRSSGYSMTSTPRGSGGRATEPWCCPSARFCSRDAGWPTPVPPGLTPARIPTVPWTLRIKRYHP